MASTSILNRSTFHPTYLTSLSVTLSLILLLSGLSPAADNEAPKAMRRSSSDVTAGVLPGEVGIGDLYALIVGVSHYKNPKIPQLKVSDKDARDFADFLKT